MGEDDNTAARRPAASGLRRIVSIRQMVRRWRSTTPTARAAAARRSSFSASSAGAADVIPSSTDQTNVDDKKPLLELLTPRADDQRRQKLPVVVGVERACGHGHDHVHHDHLAPTEPMTPMTPDALADVPRGCCAVYVGAERRRFVVPTAYLGMPVFRRLLEKAEEEFGFEYHDGSIAIPCETEAFKYILLVMDRHQNGLVDDEGNPTEAVGQSSEKREARMN